MKKVTQQSSCQRARASPANLSGGRRSGFPSGTTRKVCDSLQVETPPPRPPRPATECEDFLFAVFEQRFKANLFLLLSLYRQETGRRGPAGLLQWFSVELNETSARGGSVECDCCISLI